MSGVLDYSTTPASNTSINSIGIEGSNAVSNFDNALRQLMADIATATPNRVTKSANYTALKADHMQLIEFTAAATLALTAAATLTDGWCLYVRANGGNVTIDPNSSETINGSATITLTDGFGTLVFCNGSAFFTLGASLPFSKVGAVNGLPASSTDNAIARYDGVSGAFQDSGVTIDDSDNITTTGAVTASSGTFSGTAPELTLTDTDTGGDCVFSANNGSGSLVIRADANGEVASSRIAFQIDGTGASFDKMTLDENGDLTVTGDITASSDVRLKESIRTFSTALNTVQKLRGVRFRRKGSKEESIGFIAQEVEGVLPELVHEGDGGIKSVAYGNFTAVLVEAVKELAGRVEALEDRT